MGVTARETNNNNNYRLNLGFFTVNSIGAEKGFKFNHKNLKIGEARSSEEEGRQGRKSGSKVATTVAQNEEERCGFVDVIFLGRENLLG